jgi:DNA polymerase III alpha subunit
LVYKETKQNNNKQNMENLNATNNFDFSAGNFSIADLLNSAKGKQMPVVCLMLLSTCHYLLQFFLFCNKVIIYIIVKNQYTCSYLEKKC